MSDTPPRQPPKDAPGQEPGDVLNMVNQLGNASERLFSRLYEGFNQRSPTPDAPPGDAQQQLQPMQDKLNQSHIEIERLHGILASIEEGVIMQDLQGRIVLINRAARELLGSQKRFWESELGLRFNAYRHVDQLDTELMPLGEAERYHINQRVIGAQLAAVADRDGQRIGTVMILRDVTQDALAERLKDNFVTHISHELKTPMTVIKLASEVLLGQEEGAPANRRMLETLGRNVDTLDRMVLELLDISEMSSGSFQIRRDDISLEGVIWQAVNGHRRDAFDAGLELIVMVRDANALRVTGDDKRLRWALGHLIRNGILYNERGGFVMVMAGVEDAHAQPSAVVHVRDNGVGISEADMPHVFKRFYRGEARNRDGKRLDPRGLGQGLYVAQTVAEAHGGSVRAQSEAGVGSTFTFTLPLRQT